MRLLGVSCGPERGDEWYLGFMWMWVYGMRVDVDYVQFNELDGMLWLRFRLLLFPLCVGFSGVLLASCANPRAKSPC